MHGTDTCVVGVTDKVIIEQNIVGGTDKIDQNIVVIEEHKLEKCIENNLLDYDIKNKVTHDD